MPLLGIVVFAYLAVTIIKLDERLLIATAQTKQNAVFYDVSAFDATIANPGELLRSERLYSTPNGIVGWRMLYRSTDMNGTPIIASGLVATPADPVKADLPVVAWSHPTTGIAPKCAPSVGIDPFDSIENLRALVGAGYSVVAADYSGMGAPGPASLLISADPSVVEPWATLLKQNTPVGPSPDVPLFVAQGLKDELIVHSVTDGYVAQQKARGVNVTYDTIPNATHATVALDASGALLTWLKNLNK